MVTNWSRSSAERRMVLPDRRVEDAREVVPAMSSRRWLGFARVTLLLPSPATAQVGSGWSEYMPGKTLQTRGCGAHSASGGVETFQLTCADTSGDNRAEDRIQDDYTSGTRQFQGEVRVVSLPGTNVSVKQTFMRDNGAFLMIGVSMNGRLYSVGDNGELATEVIGRWVRINTVHDVGAGTHQIYIDGVLKVTKTGARQVAWYNKYGSYRLGSGHGPITVEWRNTRFWKDGRSEGGPPAPPPPDAGTPPAPLDASSGPDATSAPDASLSRDLARPEPEDASSEGTGGAPPDARRATGSSGTGGSGGNGAGGSGSSEESPDADEPAPRKARRGGCALVGDHASGHLVLVLVLVLVLRRPWTRPRR